MAAIDGPPGWYRGPADASGYRMSVCEDLRWMRRKARMTQKETARALSRELERHIPESSIGRWETGTKLAGADIYRAFIIISGAALPSSIGGQDPRSMPGLLLQEFDQRLARMERLRGLPPPSTEPMPEDLTSTNEAAARASVSRQTIHNWIAAHAIRAYPMGRKKLVSLSDVLAEAARRRERS